MSTVATHISQAAFYAWTLGFALAAAVIDTRSRRIPNALVATMALGFVPLSLLAGGTPLLLRGLVSAAALYAALFVLTFAADRLLKRCTMGGGDLKLIAALTLFLGWQRGLIALSLACLLALAGEGTKAVRRRIKGNSRARAPDVGFPFAPALFGAALIVVML